jgi:hypothetical protein
MINFRRTDSVLPDPTAMNRRVMAVIPLITNPNLEECDHCHEWKPILRTSRSPDAITYTGRQFLCARCLG